MCWTFSAYCTVQESQAGRLWGTVNHAVRNPYIPRMPPREVRAESQLPPASWPEAQGAGSCDPTQCGISAGWGWVGGARPALERERGFPGLPQVLQVKVLGAEAAVLWPHPPGLLTLLACLPMLSGLPCCEFTPLPSGIPTWMGCFSEEAWDPTELPAVSVPLLSPVRGFP